MPGEMRRIARFLDIPIDEARWADILEYCSFDWMKNNATTLEKLAATFATFRFSLEITEVHECADPDRLVIEYTSIGEVVATGTSHTNRYIGVYWFRDGRIAHVREFSNPDRSFRRG